VTTPAPSTSDPGRYWAAEPDSKRAAANALERIYRYRLWLRESGRAQKMTRGFAAYYGRSPTGDGDTSAITSSGKQGEWVDVTTNDYATLVTQVTVRTTANKPAFKAIATNGDVKSMEQASFAQGLLEYVERSHELYDVDHLTVKTGNICLEGWQIHGWNAGAGRNLTDFVTEAPTHEGDLEVGAFSPFRVAYDPDSESPDKLVWLAYKRRVNRFDLAAKLREKNPDVADKLTQMGSGATSPGALGSHPEDELDLSDWRSRHGASADLVWLWELRHLPTTALPNGRLLRFVDSECVVFDTFAPQLDGAGEPQMLADGLPAIVDNGYPYEELHAYRYTPDDVIGSIAGHAPAVDLLGLQECKDTLATQTMTAANAGGVSNMWVKTGGGKPTLAAVIGAMNFVESLAKPEPLEGPQLSAQVPEAAAFIDRQMMRRMGESETSMGEVPKGMPGNLAALLEAKTVQFNSRGQATYARMLERSRTGAMKLYQRFAKSDRVAVIGGTANDYKYEEWNSEKLAGFSRFVVESVNPLTQTFAGRDEAAKEMLERNMFESPQQYLLFRDTGRLEPMLESAQSELTSVRKEKELLQKGVGLPPVDPMQSFKTGKPVFVDDGQQHIRPLLYDKHWLYIPEDLGVLAMPSSRDNGAIVTAVTDVVQERIRLMKLIDPVILAVRGCPEAVMAQLMATKMPMGMPPAGGPPPPGPSGSEKPLQDEVAGLPAGAPRIAAPKPAKPPPNPLTGEKPPSPVNGAV